MKYWLLKYKEFSSMLNSYPRLRGRELRFKQSYSTMVHVLINEQINVKIGPIRKRVYYGYQLPIRNSSRLWSASSSERFVIPIWIQYPWKILICSRWEQTHFFKSSWEGNHNSTRCIHSPLNINNRKWAEPWENRSLGMHIQSHEQVCILQYG